MNATDQLTRARVCWNDLLPAVTEHLKRWDGCSDSGFTACRSAVADYLVGSTPEETELEMDVECGDTAAHLFLRWDGYLMRSGLAIEVVPRLVELREYDALVGRLEQLARGTKRVVVLAGPHDADLVQRLGNRYESALGDRMAIVEPGQAGQPAAAREGAGVIEETQLPERFRTLIDDELELYKRRPAVTLVDTIPDTNTIPIQDPLQWQQVDNAICLFIDMKGSTALSAREHSDGTARVYRLFTGTVVRLLHEVGAPYIDVQGDGAFALFNANEPHRALAAAVTCKTFGAEVFSPRVKDETGLEVGCHLGIDQDVLLVRKIGLKRHGGRTDRQNEVWAGKAVNMAAKLAAMGGHDELHVSDRFFARINDARALQTCGCPGGTKVDLWRKVHLNSDSNFDFDIAYRLGSNWCRDHGAEFCAALLDGDDDGSTRG